MKRYRHATNGQRWLASFQGVYLKSHSDVQMQFRQIIYFPWTGDSFRGTWRHTATAAAALSCLERVPSQSAVCARASVSVHRALGCTHSISIIRASLCTGEKRETCELFRSAFTAAVLFIVQPSGRLTTGREDELLDYMCHAYRWIRRRYRTDETRMKSWTRQRCWSGRHRVKHSPLGCYCGNCNIWYLHSRLLELQLYVGWWAIFFFNLR